MSPTYPKMIIFDLDDTLIQEGFPITEPIICDDTMKILQYLRTKNVKTVLATHNYSADYILEKLDLTKYFDLVLAYHDYTDKASHLWNALRKFNLNPSDVVFYDDIIENIQAVCKQGACGILVNYVTGVTFEQVELKFSSDTKIDTSINQGE